jgi:hypothetical protein
MTALTPSGGETRAATRRGSTPPPGGKAGSVSIAYAATTSSSASASSTGTSSGAGIGSLGGASP